MRRVNSASPAAPLPNWAQPRTVALVVLAVLAVKIAVATLTQLTLDEGYYALWSLYPSAGYFDHSPFVAWAIAAGRQLLGEHEIAVRLPALLCGVAIAAAQYRTGAILFDRRAGALGVYWYAAGIASLLLLLVATPDAFSTLFWTLAIWCLAELMRTQDPNWWLALGVAAGMGLLSKYTNALLGPGILLWLMASRGRWHWFARWQLWAGGAIALLLFSPVVWYNAANGWESFLFQRVRTFGTPTGAVQNLAEMVLVHLLLYWPGVVALALAGLGLALRRGPWRPGFELIALTSLPLLFYFIYHAVYAKVEGNWTMPVWPMLALAAGAAFGLRPRTGGWRLPIGALGHSTLVLGALAGVLIYTQAVLHPFQIGLADRTREMKGWRALNAAVIAEAETHGARWIATGEDYALTGLLSFYGHASRSGLPVRDLSEPFRYRFLPALPADIAGAAAILVDGTGRVDPAAHFGRVEELGVFERIEGDEVLGRYRLYLVGAPLVSSAP